MLVDNAWRKRRFGRRKVPKLRLLRMKFGPDSPVVAAVWPILGYLHTMMRDGLVLGDDEVALAMLLIRHHHEVVYAEVRRVVARMLRSQGQAQVDEVTSEIATRLAAQPDLVTGFVPNERRLRALQAYVRIAIRRTVADSIPVRAGEFELSQRTRRRYLQQGRAADSSAREIAAAAADALQNRRHHGGQGEGLTLSQLAEKLGRPESTVRKSLSRLEKDHGPAPKRGRYYRLPPTWVERIHADLAPPRKYTLATAARKVGLSPEELGSFLGVRGVTALNFRITENDLQALEERLVLRAP